MSILRLGAQVLIGSSFPAWLDITAYIEKIERTASVCGIAQEFTLICDPGIKYYLDAGQWTIAPYNTIEIYELGEKVIKGYIQEVTILKDPAFGYNIAGHDTFKRALDFFLAEKELVSKGETVAFWLTELLTRAGLTLIIDNNIANVRAIPPDTEFGLKSVAAAVEEIVVYAGGYLYVDIDGAVHFTKGTLDGGPYIFKTGDLIIHDETDASTISGGTSKKITLDKNDEMTRNIIKVWGFDPSSGGTIHATATVSGLVLPVDKTMLYATPMLQDIELAQAFAEDMALELGKFTEIKQFETIGNPSILPGHEAHYNVVFPTGYAMSGAGMVTGVDTTLDEDGYLQNITVDDFCPKFATWSLRGGDLRVVWIAAWADRGEDEDVFEVAHNEKLTWATGFLSGEPTFHQVPTIPEGRIAQMQALRDNSAVFLVMQTDYEWNETTYQKSKLWVSTNATTNDPEWKELLVTGEWEGSYKRDGTPVGEDGYTISINQFTFSGINKIQAVGDNTLHIAVRAVHPSAESFKHYYLTYEGGELSDAKEITLLVGNERFTTVTADFAHGRINSGASVSYTWGSVLIPATARFHLLDMLGTPPTTVGLRYWNTPAFDTPIYDIWQPDYNLGAANISFFAENHTGGTPPGEPNYKRLNVVRGDDFATENVTSDIGLYGTLFSSSDSYPGSSFSYHSIRGNYSGLQTQFVLNTGENLGPPDSLGVGQMYLAGSGAGHAAVGEEWLWGVVICIEKEKPSSLLWIPWRQSNANEVARVSFNSGQDWTARTGNWWSNGDLASLRNRATMQNAGQFRLVDVQPTFW